jgi:hypothetical protein
MDIFSILSTWIMMIFLQITPIADYSFIGSPIHIKNDAYTVSFDAHEPPAPDYWSVFTKQNWEDQSVTLTAGGYFDGEVHTLFSITDEHDNSYFSINEGGTMVFPADMDLRESLYLDGEHILPALEIENKDDMGVTIYSHHYSDGFVDVKFEIWDYGMMLNIKNIIIQSESYDIDIEFET